MKCVKCGGRGFIYSEMLFSAGAYGSIQQCKVCNDVAAYSREVKKRLDAIDKIKPENRSPSGERFGTLADVIPIFSRRVE